MIVVDASVWVVRFLPQDAHHQACKAWPEEQLCEGDGVVVPAHALAKVAAAISRRTADESLGRQAVELILKLPSVKVVNVAQELGLEGARVAARCRPRGADALCVAAAGLLGIPLVTLGGEQQEQGGECAEAIPPEKQIRREERAGNSSGV